MSNQLQAFLGLITAMIICVLVLALLSRPRGTRPKPIELLYRWAVFWWCLALAAEAGHQRFKSALTEAREHVGGLDEHTRTTRHGFNDGDDEETARGIRAEWVDSQVNRAISAWRTNQVGD